LNKTEGLTLGEKIKEVRQFIGMSQHNLAKVTGRGVGTISRIENNKAECDAALLRVIKKAMGISNAPLLQGENATFRERLYVWRNLINSRNPQEARAMSDDLAAILYVPFEQDLVISYIMYEIKLLIAENDFMQAEKLVTLLEAPIDQHVSDTPTHDFHYWYLSKNSLDTISNENLYHYYFNKGTLLSIHKKRPEALQAFLQAFNIDNHDFDKEASLLYNIAICYSELCMPAHAILYLERAYALFEADRTSILGNRMDNALRLDNARAVFYISIGELNLASDLLKRCLIRAESTNNHVYVGIVSHNYGCLQLKAGQPQQAVVSFDRAFDYFTKGDPFYIENLYLKARALFELSEIDDCEVLIQSGLELCRHMYPDNEKHPLLFQSLAHAITIKDADSADFLNNTAIPRLLEMYECFKALDFCKLLEVSYKRKRQAKKALEVTAVIRDIYERTMLHMPFATSS